MSLSKAVLGSFALALALGTPAFAMSSPKPMMGKATPKPTHMCRNAKGQFVKGKYLKCPNGTHAA